MYIYIFIIIIFWQRTAQPEKVKRFVLKGVSRPRVALAAHSAGTSQKWSLSLPNFSQLKYHGYISPKNSSQS